MGKLKDAMSIKGLSELGEHLESLGHDDINKIYEMVESNPDVWEELKMDSDTFNNDRQKLESIVKNKIKKKQNSKNLKLVLGGLGFALLLWIFGVFDGGSSGKGVHKSNIPSSVTEHRLDGSTVYATAYVKYGINAEYSAKDVLGVAYNLMTKKYKNANRLVLEYGMDFTNKYGEKKKVLVGTFEPDLQKLRRYADSYKYKSGEIVAAAGVYREFTYKGFR